MKYLLFLLVPFVLFGFGGLFWATESRTVVVHSTKIGGIPIVHFKTQRLQSTDDSAQPPETPEAPERPPQLEEPALGTTSEQSESSAPAPTQEPSAEPIDEKVVEEDRPNESEKQPAASPADTESSQEKRPESDTTEGSAAKPKSEPLKELKKDASETDQNWDSSKPLLGENAPDWVKVGLSQGDEHRFAIASSLATDIAQCREDFDSMLLAEVQNYLDKHILTEVTADQLELLTKKYVEDHMLVADKEFDNVQDRPSGTYHQLWRQIFISKSQLDTIRGWERSHLIRERTAEVGAMGGAALVGMVLLSGLVGLFANREKAKLKG